MRNGLGVGRCASGVLFVLVAACAPDAGGIVVDLDAAGSVRPVGGEACDGADQDGDGRVDEGALCFLYNADAVCAAGTCEVRACAPPFADCNGDAVDGCERRLGTPTDCSACGETCPTIPGDTIACVALACRTTACGRGRGDCNGDASDGCEASLDDDAHCGSCGVECPVDTVCRAGECVDAPTAISIGQGHACVVLWSGRIKCWGSNLHGELGNGGVAVDGNPVLVVSPDRYVAVAAGIYATCAIRRDGALACWGRGQDGELGDGRFGTGVRSDVPTLVPGLSGVTAVAVGNYHACAVAGGRVFCWGEGAAGEIGDGATRDRPVPTATGITDALSVGVGQAYSCALHADGHVSCWGRGFLGRLGDGRMTGSRLTPYPVVGVTTAVELNVGGVHSCVRLADGRVQCWGFNANGQLGNLLTTSSGTPVDAEVSGATALALGRSTDASGSLEERDAYSCVLRGDGRVLCWGEGSSGSLGDATAIGPAPNPPRLTPAPVHGLVDAIAIASGLRLVCAIRRTGSVECWGNGPLGQSTASGQCDTGGAVTGLP